MRRPNASQAFRHRRTRLESSGCRTRRRTGWLQMSSVLHRTIDRRALLMRGAGIAAAASLPHAVRAATNSIKELNLAAVAGRVPIVGEAYPATDVWCYGDQVPGPEIRVRQGQPIRVVVRNDLPEDTTVHWHGIRLPNAMDGVP